jgi:demethylmenaquinone methyltransferase/2-methoxy-6-polyprenyl-1,4-benzoquinol methylase
MMAPAPPGRPPSPHDRETAPGSGQAAPDDGRRPFGYQDLPAAEKTRAVRGVFDSVAGRYDLMNDLMSAGVHRLWKDDFAAGVGAHAGQLCLDVAGGTGDVAFRLARRGADVVVCDINESMLAVGRDRAYDRGHVNLAGRLAWLCAAAEALPLPDRSVDAYTIAFGLRNVTEIGQALAEARRVLKPGGRFHCLEFSHVRLAPLRRAYDAYSFSVLPRIGALVAHDAASYRYLAESIRRFPDQERLLALMAEAGLARGRYRNLSGGIAAIHSAWRL